MLRLRRKREERQSEYGRSPGGWCVGILPIVNPSAEVASPMLYLFALSGLAPLTKLTVSTGTKRRTIS